MLPAFLTTVFFSLSVIFAARSARLVGGATANLGRMVVALAVLALWAHSVGQGMAGGSMPWFLLSGCIGFGLGDVALFLSITRIGPRLTVLLAQCLAAPLGALAEWRWLGAELRGAQLLCGAVILSGVAIALAPERRPASVAMSRVVLWTGTLFGVLAALGQALGAVISRKAYAVAELEGLAIDGGTAAYQRMLGGILVAMAFLLVTRRVRPGTRPPRPGGVRAWPWIVANGLAGPTFGVGCYQWALSTTPSGIVLPIVAATPVVAIPFAFVFDGDRPSWRSLTGGLIAVAGAVALTQV